MPATEAAIIALATREGLLREADLDALHAALRNDDTHTSFEARYGAQLDALIARGLISEADVRALAERAGASVELTATPVPQPAAAVESRYRLLELIAEGGMGRVYKAFDSVLERNVALKLVKNQTHVPRAQQLAEAQRQARIEHDNVCPIYDVGELEGQPYIAMQYIDGETLKSAGSRLELEERIRIMAIAARAIHEAHRIGVVHLDVKPSNIMLEQSSDGRLKPYVLDFGVGRDLSRQEAPRGRGTPGYMAPEQRTPGGEVDRRTDVYGIGATLFEVLSGVRMKDAVSSNLPPELAAIVAKCVEEDRAERYPSAFAVAAELERYLAGEPVDAMRADLWYRIQRGLRRHKYVVATALATILTLVLIGAVRLRDQAKLEQAAALSQRFGQAAERIENSLRIARMMPLHDIRPALELAKQRTNELREEIASLRGPGFGPGQYALGRAHLAQGELEEARTYLLSAWEAGYRDREVAAALGNVHARLYAPALTNARSSENDRDRAVAEARLKYRDPALAFLNEARGTSREPERFSEALIAFCEDRFDAAISEAERAFAANPSFYEAKLLVARIHADRTAQLAAIGKQDEARASRDAAEASIVEAMSIARSDPEVYALGCRLSTDSLFTFVHHGGGDIEDTYRVGAARCARAITADPRTLEAWMEASRAHKLFGIKQSELGIDPLRALEAAAQAANQAMALQPADAQALNSLANVYRVRGEWEGSHGITPDQTFDDAEKMMLAAVALAPSVGHFQNNLGNVYRARASYAFRMKRETAGEIAKSLAAFERAASMSPHHHSPPANLGNLLLLRARTELAAGQDATQTLHKAESSLQRALSINNKDGAAKRDLDLVRQLQRRNP